MTFKPVKCQAFSAEKPLYATLAFSDETEPTKGVVFILYAFSICRYVYLYMNKQKDEYINVVNASLIEKGFMPVAPSMWTYYARDVFKPVFGLTWFNGQWWCPNKEAHERLVSLCADMTQLFAEHLTDGELHSLQAKLNQKSAWVSMKEGRHNK